MAKISKAQPLDEHTELTQMKQRQWRALNMLFLIIMLGLFVLSFSSITDYENDITRSTFTVPGRIPTPVLEMQPAHGETSIVAVVAHGLAGSKELMTSFGVELAHAGITTYLLDFPGHGASMVPVKTNNKTQPNRQDNATTIEEVVNYVHTHNKASKHPKIVLLGHSMGATAVVDYATAHENDASLIATVLISPLGQLPTTIDGPNNLLVLNGANDFPEVLAASQGVLRLNCGQFMKLHAVQGCGDISQGTARRVITLPSLNHITILNSSLTFQETLKWLQRVDPQQVKANDLHADTRLFWLILGVVSIILAMFPLCALLVEIFALKPHARLVSGKDVLICDLCLLLGIAVAIVIQYRWQPFSFVHVLFADYLSGYTFISAIVAALLFLLVRHKLPIPSFQQGIRQILLGIILALFLYATLGQLSTFAWQRVTFTLPRLGRFVIIFILVFPIFLIDEGMHRGYQEQNQLRAIVASIIFKTLLIGGLFVSYIYTPGLDFLGIMLPLLILLLLVMVGFGTQLYTSGRVALTGAVLSALLVAWCLSTTLPIT